MCQTIFTQKNYVRDRAKDLIRFIVFVLFIDKSHNTQDRDQNQPAS